MDMFCHAKEIDVWENRKSSYFPSDDKNEWKAHIFATINFYIRNKIAEHSLQQFIPHNHFVKFDIFFGKVTQTCK